MTLALTFREATSADVPALVALYTDDPLGRGRESEDLASYAAAFARVAAEPSTAIWVAEAEDRIVGTFQLTITPGLAQNGLVRATVEAVRIEARLRGRGLGTSMMAFAHEVARARGAGLVQLASNKARGDAHRFYERIGYARSHEGFKFPLA